MARQSHKDESQQIRFASRTAFDGLAIDDVEDTDEESQVAPDEGLTETAEREAFNRSEPEPEVPR